MILQNPLEAGSLYRLDLETGKVVDEYKVSDDFGVTNFLPDSKFAQTTQQQTFIGHSANGLFRIDPRLSGTKLVDSEFKQYATKAEFSAAATTEAGKLAVASKKGDIRLFDKLGKIAKTALPALGDPILGIDVSADGRWVLATCRTYLLLIDTRIPETSGSKFAGQSGFDRSFPAAEKRRRGGSPSGRSTSPTCRRCRAARASASRRPSASPPPPPVSLLLTSPS